LTAVKKRNNFQESNHQINFKICNNFKLQTGGAPELNDEFRHLAVAGRQLNKSVIVRSNLTSLLEPGI
jgi:hypothetical protein